MKFIIPIVVALAGLAVPFQAGLNAELRDRLAGPVEVGFFSSVITTVVLGAAFAFMVASGRTDPDIQTIRSVPVWLWAGGALGGLIIVASLVGASMLDAAVLVGLMIGGQMIASVVCDHFGLLSFEESPVNVWRIAGVAMIALGVYVIQRN